MPFTARTTSGETVYSFMFESGADLRKKHPYGTLISPYPDCDTPVSVRDRKGFFLHFVHKTEATTGYATNPYSPQHEIGKLRLARHFQEVYGEPIRYEVPIGNRIVDIACGIESSRIAGEVQWSPITTDQIEARSLDIMAMGFDPIWMLIGRADTEANRNWCINNLGNVYTSNIGQTTTIYENEENLRILEDLKSALIHETRNNGHISD